MKLSDLCVLMINHGAWGKGATLAEAAKSLRAAGGDPRWAITYLAHQNAYVDQTGNLVYPSDTSIREIDRKSPKATKR